MFTIQQKFVLILVFLFELDCVANGKEESCPCPQDGAAPAQHSPECDAQIKEKSAGDFIKPKIADGERCCAKSYPYIVKIQIGQNGGCPGTHRCAGTIVSSDKILTAASCCNNQQGECCEDLQVIVDPDTKNASTYQVIKCVPHPLFARDRQDVAGSPSWDVAVLVLEMSIYNPEVVKLSTYAVDRDLTQCTTIYMMGWGEAGTKINDTGSFRCTYGDLMSTGKCIQKYVDAGYTNDDYGFKSLSTKRVLCTSGVGRTCRGDEGGPIMCLEIDEIQIGIISWVVPCEDAAKKSLPSVFTRVDQYYNFIYGVLHDRTVGGGDGEAKKSKKFRECEESKSKSENLLLKREIELLNQSAEIQPRTNPFSVNITTFTNNSSNLLINPLSINNTTLNNNSSNLLNNPVSLNITTFDNESLNLPVNNLSMNITSFGTNFSNPLSMNINTFNNNSSNLLLLSMNINRFNNNSLNILNNPLSMNITTFINTNSSNPLNNSLPMDVPPYNANSSNLLNKPLSMNITIFNTNSSNLPPAPAPIKTLLVSSVPLENFVNIFINPGSMNATISRNGSQVF